jgi:hypothetical protein
MATETDFVRRQLVKLEQIGRDAWLVIECEEGGDTIATMPAEIAIEAGVEALVEVAEIGNRIIEPTFADNHPLDGVHFRIYTLTPDGVMSEAEWIDRMIAGERPDPSRRRAEKPGDVEVEAYDSPRFAELQPSGADAVGPGNMGSDLLDGAVWWHRFLVNGDQFDRVRALLAPSSNGG